MSPLSVNVISPENISHEYLIVDKSKRRIKSRLFIMVAHDKDSKQMTYYLPSLEISGYGTTQKKALNMLNECLKDFYKNLLNFSAQEVQKELSGLGWKHNTIRKKEYSKSFVDLNGSIKNINLEDKVEFGFAEYLVA